MKQTSDIETLAEKIEQDPNYRVLRRVPDLPVVEKAQRQGERVALIVDTETTGLDVQKDEVVEIGIIALVYDQSETVVGSIATFSGLRQPQVPISREAARITGLSMDDLAGRQLDRAGLQTMVELADIVIAHNASFDRPMCERLEPMFRDKPWACSATEIDWKAEGFESTKLKYLLMESGYFHDAHRALDDCKALAHLLTLSLNNSRPALSSLLEAARLPSFRIMLRANYDLRNDIRARGYRWFPGSPAKRPCWTLTGPLGEMESEINHLKSAYQPGQIEFAHETLTAFDRFRPT